MKWTERLNLELSELVSSGKTNEEIGELINTSKGSVRNQIRRLGLKRIYFTEQQCIQCFEFFLKYNHSEQKFCSNSCANTYTNLNRKHSDKTKLKISKSLQLRSENILKKEKLFKNKNTDEKIIEEKKIKVKKVRLCRFCKINVVKELKIICENCKLSYYKFYRPLCEFKFNINDFTNKFDVDLIKKFGKYSPSNKGNNLNGVSRDHMYSVKDGFVNNIDSTIIKHPANCKLLVHPENNKKKSQSSITLEELLNRIKMWDNEQD